MSLRHPFEWLPLSDRKRALLGVFVFTVLVGAGLQVIGQPLKTEDSPKGIVSFQLAGEIARSNAIVASWGPEGRVNAGLNLGLNYLFLVAYGICLSLACVLLTTRFSERNTVMFRLGIFFAWATIGAALLDAMENYALIRILLGTQLDLWPLVARWCAIPKFLILISGLTYVVLGYFFLRVMTIRNR